MFSMLVLHVSVSFLKLVEIFKIVFLEQLAKQDRFSVVLEYVLLPTNRREGAKCKFG
jgi:hypothetical protein